MSSMSGNENNPTADLPSEAEAFYRAGGEFEALGTPDLSKYPSALERLGPSPFAKTGFPLVGFLATLYDQIASTLDKPR